MRSAARRRLGGTTGNGNGGLEDGEPVRDRAVQLRGGRGRDPQVGDRFQEMYSFWVYVVAIDGDQVCSA